MLILRVELYESPYFIWFKEYSNNVLSLVKICLFFHLTKIFTSIIYFSWLKNVSNTFSNPFFKPTIIR